MGFASGVRFGLAGLMALGLAAASAPAWAQDEEAIVVPGQALDEIVQSFVGELTGAPRSEDQLARWDRDICPGVYGLTHTPTAQALIDRIAMRAVDLDLAIGEPGCAADIFIFFTDAPAVLAEELRGRFERLLNARNISTLGRTELAAFVNSPAPVRWWSIAATKSRFGLEIGSDLAVRDLSSSRVRRLTRQDLSRIIIIVDANLADGLRVGALGDFLAMVSLAQIDAQADTSAYFTILNLFEGGPNAMTAWDLAYLEGLYGATRAARSAAQQEGQIRRAMLEELGEGEAETP